jgi:hypothetical protein
VIWHITTSLTLYVYTPAYTSNLPTGPDEPLRRRESNKM